MATIGKVSAIYTANTSGLVSGTATAGAAFKRLSGDVAGLGSSMRTLVAIQGAQLFGSIASAVGNAARSFVGMAQGQAETIDKTSKLSRQLGMTYGELSGLALAGDLAGVSMETIGKAATKSDVAFVKAAQGSKVAQAAFAGIGLSVDQLQNKSPAERFQMIADAIAGLPSPAERSRAAIQLFGKAGAELLPLFEGGAGSIAAAVDEANKFGLALTNEQGVAVENMNDAFTRAYASIQGVVQQVVAYLAPAIQTVADTFTTLIGNVGGTTIGQTIGEGILAGAEFLATIADAVIGGLSAAWEYASTVGAQWGSIWEIGNRVAAFFSGVANTLKLVFGAAILGLTAPITALLKAADFLAKSVGVNLGVESFINGADAFNQSIRDSMTEASTAAGQDFSRMVSGGPAGEQATKGPAGSMVADAVKAAREQAAARNTAEKSVVKPKTADVAEFTGPSVEVLKGVDSSSKEGVAEMFRLMRGTESDVAEQQLSVLEDIRYAVSEGDAMALAELGA